jgi:transcriptional regulator with XRE-family HTH domain
VESPGNLLKKVREKLNLRYRDVEQASHEIARRHGSDEYVIALSRLADIENKGTLPTLYRLYSLCAIYRLNPMAVMRWYGLPLDRLQEDSLLSPPRSTNLISVDLQYALELPATEPIPLEPLEMRSTHVLPKEAAADGWLARSLLGLPRPKSIRIGVIGERDESMAPVLPARSIVLIDDSRKRIARSGWRHEAERPIYFLETRNGAACRWCSLQDEEIVAIPHPSSTAIPERFRTGEVEIVGEIAAVAMLRPPARQHRTRS